REVDVAVLVGERMTRHVPDARRPLALDDAEHLHPGQLVTCGAALAAQERRENRLARAIDAFGRRARDLGVRDIARDGVEARRLRGERRARDIEDAKQTHDEYLRSLAAQRLAQAFDAHREEIETRLVTHRGLGERGLLELGIDGIAV